MGSGGAIENKKIEPPIRKGESESARAFSLGATRPHESGLIEITHETGDIDARCMQNAAHTPAIAGKTSGERCHRISISAIGTDDTNFDASGHYRIDRDLSRRIGCGAPDQDNAACATRLKPARAFDSQRAETSRDHVRAVRAHRHGFWRG